MIRYEIPKKWIHYSFEAVFKDLSEAKAAMMSLKSIPYLKGWAEAMQVMQFKREVEGTSRIEGADVTDRELEAALKESPEELKTRSQKQVAAAAATYRWLENLPTDKPINAALICEIHRRLVTGADDNHCSPGEIRKRDENVIFGSPRHRGVEGGEACQLAFNAFCEFFQKGFGLHDELIQALALHYHFAAMHPFLDGNGRTARALEALLLQRAGLRGALFIAMSNYYYDEKTSYLKTLSDVRANDHDLTPFLTFGLKGIAVQCQRLASEIKFHLSKALYQNQMTYLFGRLQSEKKRVIAQRHAVVMNLLLEIAPKEMELDDLIKATHPYYSQFGNPRKTLIRDLIYLLELDALKLNTQPENIEPKTLSQFFLSAHLQWAEEVTETAFFQKVSLLPKAKTLSFLSRRC